MTVFYQKFDSLRKEHGETLKEVSDATGIATSTMAEWKKDSKTREHLVIIADHYDVSIDYLLGRTANPKSHKEFVTAPLMSIMQAALKSELDLKSAKAVIQLIETLSNKMSDAE